MTMFNNLVLIFHIILILTFTCSAFIIKSKKLLIFWLFLLILNFTHWQINDVCILNKIESPENNDKSIIIIWLTKQFKLSYKSAAMWWVVFMMFLPATYVTYKLLN